MRRQRYRDRREAASVLSDALSERRGREDVLVLALPRGGVPVGYGIAQALDVDLDVMVVRKLGVPMQPELAMGAIAMGGARVVNTDVVEILGVTPSELDRVTEREREELRRRELTYRDDRPFPEVHGKKVILVDDGIATGATMRAAIAAVRRLGAAEVIVAVPVGPADTVASLADEADSVVCPLSPVSFFGISQFYDDFAQISDEEVRDLLSRRKAEQQSRRAPEAVARQDV